MHKILVPLEVRPEYPGRVSDIHYVRISYTAALAEVHLLPLFAPPTMPQEYIQALYQECEGVLIMGGDDIGSDTYGQELHAATHAYSPARDKLEVLLAGQAVRDKKPVLGICRGAQAINIALGGDLHQHLPEITDEDHSLSKIYDDHPTAQKRKVLLTPKTRAAAMFKEFSVKTNSGHHQAINNIGEGLLVSGTSAAGVVEIIEHQNPDIFCMGTQFHPEIERPAVRQAVFGAFAKAISGRA